jgi:hypothetical protein
MMLGATVAMTIELRGFARSGNLVLLVVGGAIAATGLWLALEAVLAVRRYRRGPPATSLDLDPS